LKEDGFAIRAEGRCPVARRSGKEGTAILAVGIRYPDIPIILKEIDGIGQLLAVRTPPSHSFVKRVGERGEEAPSSGGADLNGGRGLFPRCFRLLGCRGIRHAVTLQADNPLVGVYDLTPGRKREGDSAYFGNLIREGAPDHFFLLLRVGSGKLFIGCRLERQKGE